MHKVALFIKALSKEKYWLSALINVVTKLKWFWVEACSRCQIHWELITYNFTDKSYNLKCVGRSAKAWVETVHTKTPILYNKYICNKNNK